MGKLQIQFLLVGASLVVLVLGEPTAKGHSKRRNKHAHSHGHVHRDSHEDEGGHGHSHGGHGHSHSSKWSFGAGISLSQSLGGESADSGEDGGSEAEHGHSHGLRGNGYGLLHEGHSHDGGAEGEEGEEAESGFEPALSLNAGYRITKRLSLTSAIGYTQSGGIGDPSLGVAYGLPMSRSSSFSSSFSASFPLSKASQDNFKITTLSVGAGPTYNIKRYILAARATMAKSYYSKTVIVEEAEEEENGENGETLRLQDDHDHDHADGGEAHDHELAEGGTGDREFDRYGLTGNLGYKLAKRWALETGLGMALVKSQFGVTTIETNATIVQGTYSWKQFAASMGLITSGADESFTIPTTPAVTAGVFYIYE